MPEIAEIGLEWQLISWQPQNEVVSNYKARLLAVLRDGCCGFYGKWKWISWEPEANVPSLILSFKPKP